MNSKMNWILLVSLILAVVSTSVARTIQFAPSLEQVGDFDEEIATDEVAADEETPLKVLDNILETAEQKRMPTGRQLDFFRRIAINAALSREKDVREAIKCIFGMDCSAPPMFKDMLRREGMTVLTTGRCSPGTCSPATEALAKDFQQTVARRHPQLYDETMQLIREIQLNAAHQGR